LASVWGGKNCPGWKARVRGLGKDAAEEASRPVHDAPPRPQCMSERPINDYGMGESHFSRTEDCKTPLIVSTDQPNPGKKRATLHGRLALPDPVQRNGAKKKTEKVKKVRRGN